jgi:beta-glucosidase
MNTKASLEKEKSIREKEHEKIAYDAALEGIVLLKNEGILPVAPGKVALFGAGAKRTVKGGSGSGEVNERHSISIMEGLINKGFEVMTMDWIEDYEKDYEEARTRHQNRLKEHFKRRNLQQMMDQPFRYPYGRRIQKRDIDNKDTDLCIYVISRQSGEGSDRWLRANDFHLSEMERENLSMCARFYQKILVVLNMGGSFDVRFVEEIPEIKGLVFFAQQGCQGGNAFGELITGAKNFSGKLTDTWYRSYEQVPFYDDFSYMRGNPMNAFYEEGIYVGYRYCDAYKIAPQYPFGYGMSYTSFQWDLLEAKLDKTKVLLRCRVKNRGNEYSGKEIIQFYISCPQLHIKKEFQKLVAFYKTTELAPGEEEVFEIEICIKSFASYHEKDASFLLDEGDYILRIGNSSRNTQPCLLLNLDSQAFTSIHQNVCKTRSEVREIAPADIEYFDDLNLLPRIQLYREEIDIETFDYDKQKVPAGEMVTKLMEDLSDYDLVQLVVGSGMKKALMNQNYFNVPGAAGSTTSKLAYKGVSNAVFADGPAGLRLAQRSTLQPRGKIKMVDAPMDFFQYLPKFVKKRIFGDPKKHPVVYQFATAFPIATSLAQSWNIKLVEKVGEALGREMQEFGVDFWLGPGMNIHRNPLGGRNYEYYSEDPYLTGKIAAAAIRGCQKFRGNKASIKHFCVNNQEENRQRVSSNINERALREIYLRGFEIAVKEGQPKGVMTSYNRINGTYTANSYDLCTKILRNEWGFEGVVMTDWYATGKNLADAAMCIKAGNDLIMPGKKQDKKRIYQSIRKKELAREDLNRCAQNILVEILEKGNNSIAKKMEETDQPSVYKAAPQK